MRAKVLAASPDLTSALSVAEDFREMLRTRAADTLPAWLARAEQSPMPELAAFAGSLRRDYAAVEAALAYG